MLISLGCNFLAGDHQLSPGSLIWALQSLLQCNFVTDAGCSSNLGFWWKFLIVFYSLEVFCFFVMASYSSSPRVVCQEKLRIAPFPGL